MKELVALSNVKPDTLEYHIDNPSFVSGVAEYFYQLLRLIKPKRLFEIGSGNSGPIAIKAIRRDNREDPGRRCKHICVEPYEALWLESAGVTVVRQGVENLDIQFFAELEENGILFIDSSHIIRPQGDVLFEYLELLPTLKKEVIVHVHDVF